MNVKITRETLEQKIYEKNITLVEINSYKDKLESVEWLKCKSLFDDFRIERLRKEIEQLKEKQEQQEKWQVRMKKKFEELVERFGNIEVGLYKKSYKMIDELKEELVIMKKKLNV
jgi:predicted nuclease with TOPRIM domain